MSEGLVSQSPERPDSPKPSKMIPLRDISAGKEPILVKRELLRPDFVADSILDIDFEQLRKQGVRFLVCDVDNTLTRVGGSEVIPKYLEYLKRQREAGVVDGIFLASNSGRDLSQFADSLDATIIPSSPSNKKPYESYFRGVVETIGCEARQAVMVGDKVSHDIAGANKVGMVTVLVGPVGPTILYDWVTGTAIKERIYRRRIRKEIG